MTISAEAAAQTRVLGLASMRERALRDLKSMCGPGITENPFTIPSPSTAGIPAGIGIGTGAGIGMETGMTLGSGDPFHGLLQRIVAGEGEGVGVDRAGEQ